MDALVMYAACVVGTIVYVALVAFWQKARNRG